jgi:hypothetical protein
MKVSIDEFGLVKGKLYEILVTSVKNVEDQYFLNTAAMGIKLFDSELVKMWPYEDTQTAFNLKNFKYATLNFIEDVDLFAIASLKGTPEKHGLLGIANEEYKFKKIQKKEDFEEGFFNFPFLKKAWGIAFCKVHHYSRFVQSNKFGSSKRYEIDLKVLSCEKLRETYKLINRAENITLETIVLATRLKYAKDMKDFYLLNQLKKEINDRLERIRSLEIDSHIQTAVERIITYMRMVS